MGLQVCQKFWSASSVPASSPCQAGNGGQARAAGASLALLASDIDNVTVQSKDPFRGLGEYDPGH